MQDRCQRILVKKSVCNAQHLSFLIRRTNEWENMTDYIELCQYVLLSYGEKSQTSLTVMSFIRNQSSF